MWKKKRTGKWRNRDNNHSEPTPRVISRRIERTLNYPKCVSSKKKKKQSLTSTRNSVLCFSTAARRLSSHCCTCAGSGASKKKQAPRVKIRCTYVCICACVCVCVFQRSAWVLALVKQEIKHSPFLVSVFFLFFFCLSCTSHYAQPEMTASLSEKIPTPYLWEKRFLFFFFVVLLFCMIFLFHVGRGGWTCITRLNTQKEKKKKKRKQNKKKKKKASNARTALVKVL